MHEDSRGCLTELFRREWQLGIDPVQWNFVRSEAGVLRGVHVHARHDDYLVVTTGRATIGIRDLRPGAAEGRASLVEVSETRMEAIRIPAGVAHGFYFHTPAIHIYSVSHYWDPADELGCHWADPDLGIPWPFKTAVISPRDENLPPYRVLSEQLQAMRRE
jgi:dTDP-4-dehydrorhamnose 3,5-epimerase